MRRSLNREELLDISSSLEDYHTMFYTFWGLSDVVYDDKIKTLAVKLADHNGALDSPLMLINKDFWDRHNKVEHLFMVLHECLHIVLNHGERNGMEIPGATRDLVNRAQDITINEMIVSVFGYIRSNFREWKKYCWIDTCFKDPSKILKNETFTYYLKKLIEDLPKKTPEDSKNEPETLDEHPTDEETEQLGDSLRNKILEDLIEDLTPEELESMMKSGIAGTALGTIEMFLAKKYELAKLRLNFPLLIRKLKRTRMKTETQEYDTFSRDNRRFDDIIISSKAALPGKGERERLKKDKLLVILFMDISGSCLLYFKKFQEVYQAFDKEREIFEIRLFTFDTSVREIKATDRLYGGGGTAYDILETKVLELQNEYVKYPDCVVVLTDGYGTNIEPKIPQRWVWLLTEDSIAKYIPKNSGSFKIKEVTF